MAFARRHQSRAFLARASRRGSCRHTLYILVALWALTPTAALADSGRPQAGAQGGGVSVSGIVLDPSGAILPGAAVDLLDAQGAAIQTTAADAGAAFHFDHVAQGTYQIRASFSGLKTSTTRVRVGARAPSLVKVVMALPTVDATISVGDADNTVSTAASNNLSAVAVDRQMLQGLPMLDQDLIGTVSHFLDPGSLGTGGATLVVNGMEVSALRVRRRPCSKSGSIRILIRPNTAARVAAASRS